MTGVPTSSGTVAEMVSLTVVVPATDRPSTLAACRGAIAASSDQPDEVIVVDGPATLGVCEARNAGASQAGGEVLVFVDADVFVHPDAIGRIRRAFDADPALTACFGSYDDAPSAPGVVARFRNLLHHHVHHDGAGEATTFWSGLGAIRRDAFLAVGGFDADRYPVPSIEDIDLGRRIHAAGGRIVVDPSIQGCHAKAWTLRSMIATDVRRRGVPWVALAVREGGGLDAGLNLGWRHRASALATMVAVLGVAVRRPALSGAAVGALVVANHRFYRLLGRRLGWQHLPTGIALHAVHHASAVASVPIGVVVGLTDRGIAVPHASPRVPSEVPA